MSDEGERTCPLCAEEMDLTDQQLKPCKCGYEVIICSLSPIFVLLVWKLFEIVTYLLLIFLDILLIRIFSMWSDMSCRTTMKSMLCNCRGTFHPYGIVSFTFTIKSSPCSWSATTLWVAWFFLHLLLLVPVGGINGSLYLLDLLL